MLRVLLADDDRVSCKLLASLLNKWGYEVTTVHDGVAAASELMKLDAPQVAILDWMMPGFSGPEVIKSVREESHGAYIYILLLTSRGQRGDLVEGMNAGADGYLRKPFDPDELRAWVQAGKRIIDLQAALMRAQDALQFSAAHDSLTGLWNRGAVFELLEREIARRQRSGDAMGVAMADIDHFKKINDTHGHIVGDAVLQEVARRLAAEVRPCDVVGRYGGEEFLIVFPGCNASSLTIGAERLRRAIADYPIETNQGLIRTTISLGLSSVELGDSEPLDCETFVREADEALYAAKADGRNCLASAGSRAVAQQGKGTGPWE
jgi:two-component system cell cycle response regulator